MRLSFFHFKQVPVWSISQNQSCTTSLNVLWSQGQIFGFLLTVERYCEENLEIQIHSFENINFYHFSCACIFQRDICTSKYLRRRCAGMFYFSLEKGRSHTHDSFINNTDISLLPDLPQECSNFETSVLLINDDAEQERCAGPSLVRSSLCTNDIYLFRRLWKQDSVVANDSDRVTKYSWKSWRVT